MRISQANCTFEREPLSAPFGFKGGYLSELWQTVVHIADSAGKEALGLGTQSVLWSDAHVFVNHPEAAGNSLMFLTTAYAARLAQQHDWDTPIDLLDAILPDTYAYAQHITQHPDLRLTFALNALVALDNAAWQYYAHHHHAQTFDDMVPPPYRAALTNRQHQLATIPLMSYGVSRDEIAAALDQGYFFLKIKIGADPDKDGNPDKMLAWDKARLSEIHQLARNRQTAFTQDGTIPYYLDANGRYADKTQLMKLLDHADKIGALERIILLEEPFPEDYRADVSDLPVRLAADESAHSDRDAQERIDMGYRAIALKPIAKTMSMSLKIAQLAHQRQIPCFCADLTVNPILVDWNKNVAARLAPLPGMNIGVLESNGHQNYQNWTQMQTYHPCAQADWLSSKQGLFQLNDQWYANAGGIFQNAPHYRSLLP